MQYEIKGTPFPAVICHLQDGEQMITEGGGMSWMTPNMVMETTTNGGLGKAFGRLFSGDKMFQNRYTCRGGEGMISFTSCCPGNIRAVEIHPGQSVICQKSAFLASTPGVNMSIYFKKALGAGLFAVKVLLCRNLKARESSLLSLTALPLNMIFKPANSLFLTQAISQLWTALAIWIFKPLKVLKTFSSAAKDFSTQL